MNIFQRIFGKQSETYRSIVIGQEKQLVYSGKDFRTLSEQGYQNCMTVYACVNLVSQAVASVPWSLYEKTSQGKAREIKEHPILDLLDRPNPREGGPRFTEKTISYMQLSGNCYIERVGPNNGPPKELYALRPDRVQVIVGNSMNPVAGYQYSVGGMGPVTFAEPMILHLRTFHPTDDWYGLSPISVAAKGIDIQNYAQNWLGRLVVNDARPAGALKVQRSLTEDQYKRLRKQTNRQMFNLEGGDGNWLLLEGGAEWQELGLSPKDMDWLKADSTNTRKICSVFKVAPELIGDAENKTFSNYGEARTALYVEAAVPILEWLKSEWNNWLCPLFGDNLFVTYKKEKIDALQADRKSLAEQLERSWWMSLNERRIAQGLDEWPNGDKLFLPLGLSEWTGEEKPIVTPDQQAEEEVRPPAGQEEEESAEEGGNTPQEVGSGANAGAVGSGEGEG